MSRPGGGDLGHDPERGLPDTADAQQRKDELVSGEIARIAPYQPGKPLEELRRELGASWPAGGAIKLASNENPLGPSPRAIDAARAALAEGNLYPEGSSFYLRHALALRHNVQPEQIVVGAGSN